MATALLYKDNIVLTIFLIIISYILWILAFLISNISLIEESVEYLPNWATKLLAWMGVPKAVVQQVKVLKEAVVKNNKRQARKITDVLHVVASRSMRGLEHSNWRVRKEALDILSSIAVESFGLVWDLKTEIIYLLVEMLKDPVADIRSSARLALAKIGPQAMEALRTALRKGDPELGEEIDWCLRMMKRMANDRLKANDWRERLRAVNDLAQMVRPTQEDEINDLGSALNDNYKEVRLAVIKALISIGTSDVIPFLKQALEDHEEEIQQKATEGLSDMRQELLVRLRNEDLGVKADAVKGLGLIGNEEDIERLKSCLLDKYTSVRVEAVKALSSIGGEKVVDALIKALNDKAERVRGQAVEALNSMGEPAVEPLREAQKKEADPNVRQVIISALTNLENTYPHLIANEHSELPLSEKLKRYFQLQDSIKSEYREITFVDIDVAGSTNLKEGESKESVVYSFLQYNQTLDNLAQKYHGEVFNRIGDERIFIFKNPTDAVNMGIELQNALLKFNKDKTKNRLNQPFKVRIGINTGDILIDKTVESSDVAEYTLDVTCHLQKYGEPDTVYISENTYSNLELKTGNLFEGPFEFQKDNIKVYIYRSMSGV